MNDLTDLLRDVISLAIIIGFGLLAFLLLYPIYIAQF